MTPRQRQKQLLYLDKSTPEEFQNAELMGWIYLVGDISTQYELDFVRQFGYAIQSRPHTPAAPRPPCEECIYQARSEDEKAAIRKAGREQVLDALEEFLNSDDHLSLFKWEVREQIRSLRGGDAP